MTRYGRQPFCRPVQTYIIYILIGLDLYIGIQITTRYTQDLVLNTTALLPLPPVLTAGDYIIVST